MPFHYPKGFPGCFCGSLLSESELESTGTWDRVEVRCQRLGVGGGFKTDHHYPIQFSSLRFCRRKVALAAALGPFHIRLTLPWPEHGLKGRFGCVRNK